MAIRFNVGPWAYSVRVVDRLKDEHGTPIMGRADLDSLSLLIDSSIKPEARMAVILHELRHAWGYHFPTASDPEQEADFSATMMAAFMRDYQSQRRAMDEFAGMCPAVVIQAPPKPSLEPRHISPLSYVTPADCVAPAHTDCAQCSKCSSLVGNGSIVQSKPYRIGRFAWAINRTLFCAHCHLLQTWAEGYDYGRPTGAIVDSPHIIDEEAAIDAFLTEYPEAAGVVLV